MTTTGACIELHGSVCKFLDHIFLQNTQAIKNSPSKKLDDTIAEFNYKVAGLARPTHPSAAYMAIVKMNAPKPTKLHKRKKKASGTQ